jgi:hypothetical protein
MEVGTLTDTGIYQKEFAVVVIYETLHYRELQLSLV